jgi:hypothetical protein
MFEGSKAKLKAITVTPEVARVAAMVAGVALIVAILALGVAIGKGHANAH